MLATFTGGEPADEIILFAEQTLNGNALFTGMGADWGAIVGQLRILRNGSLANPKGPGTPRQPLRPGPTPGLPALPFTPTPPPVSTPFLIANNIYGQTSGAIFTTTAFAPRNSLIIVLLAPQSTVTSVQDSANNTYQQAVASAITSPNIAGASIWYSLPTAADLPVGGTIRVNGPSSWAGIVYAAAGVTGGLDKTASGIVTTLTATSASLSLGTISQANELCFGLLVGPQNGVSYVGNVESWNSGPASPELFDGTYTLASYLITSSIGSVSYTPSWNGQFPAPYAGAACSFIISGASNPIPTVTSVTPNNGPVGGGTVITNIAGTNFLAGASVSFGGTPATSVVVNSSTSISCVTPAHTVGTVSVLVTTTAGTNSANSLFTYTSSASIGTPVNILQDGATNRNSGAVTGATIALSPAGNLIVCSISAVGFSNGTHIQTLTDSASPPNNYQLATASHVYYDAEIWYCSGANALPSGGTFTATTSTGGQYSLNVAATISGANGGFDAFGTNTGNGVTTITVTSGTTSTATEIAFATTNGLNAGTYTEAAGWTELSTLPDQTNPLAYKQLSGIGTAAWTPSFTPSSQVDAIIATFQITGSATVGTGLSSPSQYLPTDLPGSTNMSGAVNHWHLTARPWAALGVTAASYLTRVANEAAYWVAHLNGSGQAIDPYVGGVTDADRGRLPFGIGVLLKSGNSTYLSGGLTMLNTAISAYSSTEGTTEFYTDPVYGAIPYYITYGGQSNSLYTGHMNNYYGVTSGHINNWVTYAMIGLWAARLDVVNNSAPLTVTAYTNPTTTNSTMETLWTQQINQGGPGSGAFNDSPWFLYRDGTGPPDSLCVESIARNNLTRLVAEGYNGASSGTMDQYTQAAAFTSLLMQDPSGQNPAGGRQDNQNWVDAWDQVVMEVMAQKFAGTNAFLAGQFQHAAMLNFNNVARWANPNLSGTFFIPKNHFNPTLQVGYQANYQYMYNLDVAMAAAVSYTYRTKSVVVEQPCPTEIGGYAFALPSGLSPSLNFAFANAGGTSVEISLNGATVVNNGQYWTAIGFLRIGRVNWETRLGPQGAGYFSGNQVSFAPTWYNGSAWTRLAANPSTSSGAFTTRFVSPGLVLATVVWTVSGGTFTQNLTITPDGVLVQTTSTGFSAGNWGVTYPVLIDDGTTSGGWGATATTTSLTQPIASATWSNNDSQNFITISSNTVVFTSESNCLTSVGDVTPVRSVVSADTTHTTFVYPATNAGVTDPSAASVRSTFTVTGTNTYTCTALGSSVTSDSSTGTVYIGRTCASGWASTFTLSGGTVTFSVPCFFIAQVSSGHVTAIEVDRAVATATIQSHGAQALSAYTPVTGL